MSLFSPASNLASIARFALKGQRAGAPSAVDLASGRSPPEMVPTPEKSSNPRGRSCSRTFENRRHRAGRLFRPPDLNSVDGAYRWHEFSTGRNSVCSRPEPEKYASEQYGDLCRDARTGRQNRIPRPGSGDNQTEAPNAHLHIDRHRRDSCRNRRTKASLKPLFLLPIGHSDDSGGDRLRARSYPNRRIERA